VRLAALLMDLRPGKAEFVNNSGLGPETCGLENHQEQPCPEAPNSRQAWAVGFFQGPRWWTGCKKTLFSKKNLEIGRWIYYTINKLCKAWRLTVAKIPPKSLEFLTAASPYWGGENNNRANHPGAAGNPKKGEFGK